jgi:hypothetical protein
LEEDWTHLQLLTNTHKNSCGIFPTPVPMFGGCSEQKFDDLLGKWLALSSRNASQESGVRGRSWCLEEVWTQMQVLTNRHENRHGVFPLLASMFGGHTERQLEDLLVAWPHLAVETQVNEVE